MAICMIRQEMSVTIQVETIATPTVAMTTETATVEAAMATRIIIAQVAARQTIMATFPTLGGSPVMQDNLKAAHPQRGTPTLSTTPHLIPTTALLTTINRTTALTITNLIQVVARTITIIIVLHLTRQAMVKATNHRSCQLTSPATKPIRCRKTWSNKSKKYRQ